MGVHHPIKSRLLRNGAPFFGGFVFLLYFCTGFRKTPRSHICCYLRCFPSPPASHTDLVVYLRCSPPPHSASATLDTPLRSDPFAFRRRLVYTLLGGVFSRRGTRKSVEQGASYSERVYPAIRTALRLSIIAVFYTAMQKKSQKNLRMCNFCCNFAG